MADQSFADILNIAIDRLNGGMSLDDCLRDFPDDAAQLRPLLESGLLVQRILPTETELAAARGRSARRLERALTQTPRRAQPFVWRMAQVAALLLMLFGITGVAAESSLPGETLYPLKRLTEGARTLVSGASFEERRIDEIQSLFTQARAEAVQFSGIVETMGERWQVEGIEVLPPVSVPNDVQVGDRVEVAGETTPEQVVRAGSIRLLDDNTLPLTPSPTPPATPSVTPAPSATLTSTVTPPSTASITPLPSATATATVTASSTVTITLPPSATPAPTSVPFVPPAATDDDDDDDDDDDSDNRGRGSGNSGRGGGSDDDGDDDGSDNSGSDSSGGNDDDDDGD